MGIRRGTVAQLFGVLILVAALLVVPFPAPQPVSAAGGDYSIDMAAADPQTYPHIVPPPRQTQYLCPTDGRGDDPLDTRWSGNVESLMPTSLALGQVVVYQFLISTTGSTAPGSSIAFRGSWDTVTSSGQQFGFDPNYGVVCAFVDTSDPDVQDAGSREAYVDGFRSEVPAGRTDIQGTIGVSGLEPNERIVVEVWVVLMDKIPEGITLNSNVHTELMDAYQATPACFKDCAIKVGQQTIPLMHVGDFTAATAEVVVTKSAPEVKRRPMDTILYTVMITNTSAFVANGVLLTDNIDIHTEYVADTLAVFDTQGSPTESVNCSIVDKTITCDLQYLAPEESVRIEFSVRLLWPTPVTGTALGGPCVDDPAWDLCNRVSVSAMNDTDPANNEYSWATDAYVLPYAVDMIEPLVATYDEGRIRLAWETSSERNHQGFRISRAPKPNGPWTEVAQLDSDRPGSTSGQAYQWDDLDVGPGGYVAYRLYAVDVDEMVEDAGTVSLFYGDYTRVWLPTLRARW